MDDNYGTLPALLLDWGDLVKALVATLKDKSCHIKCNTPVTSIQENADGIVTVNNMYSATKCIVATTVDALLSLFPTNSIYKHIHGQPFMRQYAQFSKRSRVFIGEKVKRGTVVIAPLQKFIPINPEKGVYMIAYADNNSALQLQPHSNDIKYFEKQVSTALDIPLDHVHITKMSPHFWNIGTHYFDPLQKQYATRQDFIKVAQHPSPNVWVVGEAVALHQGWVEGALESVHAVFG
jgi:hypothetical protein